ncbi:HTH-type transcriptional regulator YiaJ [Amycolatopsis sp. M39]|nr:IclR family transcriptional regulator [Amycolatopsis rubida]OAP23366.1 HTH-type transcriptional regulator YiaJ [Amycolatopsis sp. M39]
MAPTSGRQVAPPPEHRTVVRVMSILELVLASDPQGVRLGDLAASIDAPKSSVHGLARGLVAIGYFREENGRYFIGPAISTILAVGPAALPSVYRYALEQLASKWNETATLASLVGESVVYLDSVHPDAFIRAAPQLNKRLTLWPRASGRCFLAFMEPKKIDAFLRRNASAPEDTDALREELATIRKTRIAYNIGETVADHLGIASPIIIGDKPVTVAIALAGPRSRMEGRVDEMAQSLLETVESLSNFQEE